MPSEERRKKEIGPSSGKTHKENRECKGVRQIQARGKLTEQIRQGHRDSKRYPEGQERITSVGSTLPLITIVKAKQNKYCKNNCLKTQEYKQSR